MLRVYVFAPQENAPSIHEGLAAKILLEEYPGQEFDGKVTRTAGALDPQSRTMQVEVQVPNHDGKLYAGMYGQVKFLLVDQNAPIVVPANAFYSERKDRRWQRLKTRIVSTGKTSALVAISEIESK